MVRALLWLHDKITDVGFQLGKLCLAIILFAYSFEVISRYFFSAPTWWADEAVSYSLCIGCFLMMPHVTREKGHVAVTFLIDLLPAKKAKVAAAAGTAAASSGMPSIESTVRHSSQQRSHLL